MSLIHNEQTKLLASALDRTSTACVTVGVLAPIAAWIYDLGPGGIPERLTIGLGALIWLAAAVARWRCED